MTDRTERFEFRMTPEEKQRYETAAAERGVSLADYLRLLLPKKDELKVKQLLVAPFQSVNGPLSYSTLALSEDGRVYRYDPKCKGWLPWSMEIATCIDEHPGGR